MKRLRACFVIAFLALVSSWADSSSLLNTRLPPFHPTLCPKRGTKSVSFGSPATVTEGNTPFSHPCKHSTQISQSTQSVIPTDRVKTPPRFAFPKAGKTALRLHRISHHLPLGRVDELCLSSSQHSCCGEFLAPLIFVVVVVVLPLGRERPTQIPQHLFPATVTRAHLQRRWPPTRCWFGAEAAPCPPEQPPDMARNLPRGLKRDFFVSLVILLPSQKLNPAGIVQAGHGVVGVGFVPLGGWRGHWASEFGIHH